MAWISIQSCTAHLVQLGVLHCCCAHGVYYQISRVECLGRSRCAHADQYVSVRTARQHARPCTRTAPLLNSMSLDSKSKLFSCRTASARQQGTLPEPQYMTRPDMLLTRLKSCSKTDQTLKSNAHVLLLALAATARPTDAHVWSARLPARPCTAVSAVHLRAPKWSISFSGMNSVDRYGRSGALQAC
jgi:hypothetical protein